MKTRTLLQDIPVWLYLFFAAIILGATIYQMMVIVPEFDRDAPNGMIGFAQSRVDPRNFWRSPITVLSDIVMVIALVSNWKTDRRKWLLISIAFMAAAIISTVVYFVPRLQIMGLIDDHTTADMGLLKVTIKEWIRADILRCWLLVVPCFFFGLKAATVPVVIKQNQKNTRISKFETAIAG